MPRPMRMLRLRPRLRPTHMASISIAARTSRRHSAHSGRGSALGDFIAQHRALAGRDADQLGDAPDQIVLELMVLAVGKHYLPHHADDLDPLRFVELGERRGEMVEIDGFGIALPCLADEAAGSVLV